MVIVVIQIDTIVYLIKGLIGESRHHSWTIRDLDDLKTNGYEMIHLTIFKYILLSIWTVNCWKAKATSKISWDTPSLSLLSKSMILKMYENVLECECMLEGPSDHQSYALKCNYKYEMIWKKDIVILTQSKNFWHLCCLYKWHDFNTSNMRP